MSTLNQSIKKKRIKKNKKTILNNNPQVKGLLLKIVLASPKKPNSANRKVAVVRLKNGKKVKAHIPGEKSYSRLKENTKILIRGGNTKDLPGINHKVIFTSSTSRSGYRMNKKSKYGIKSIDQHKI